MAELARWPKDEWGLQLVGALEGKARRVLTADLLSLEERPSFKKVSKLLRSSFASDASPAVWLSALEHRHRREKESLTELSQAILDLTAKAFPTLGQKDRQRLAVGYFARAQSEHAQSVRIMAATPSKLSKALEIALAYENAERTNVEHESRSKRNNQPRVCAYGDESGQSAGGAAVYAVKDGQPPFARDPQGSAQGRGGGGGKGRGGRNKSRDRQWEERADAQSFVSQNDTVSQLKQQIADLTAQMRQLQPVTPPQNELFSAASAGRGRARELPPRIRAAQASGACYKCGALDHWVRECPSRQQGPPGSGHGRGGASQGQENGSGRGTFGQSSGQFSRQ